MKQSMTAPAATYRDSPVSVRITRLRYAKTYTGALMFYSCYVEVNGVLSLAAHYQTRTSEPRIQSVCDGSTTIESVELEMARFEKARTYLERYAQSLPPVRDPSTGKVKPRSINAMIHDIVQNMVDHNHKTFEIDAR